MNNRSSKWNSYFRHLNTADEKPSTVKNDTTGSPNSNPPGLSDPTGYKSRSCDGTNDHGFTVEDVSGQGAGYDGDVEVVKPYEYEEANSEPQTPCNIRNIKKLEFDELWSTGLIDSMNTLHCDSDKERHHRLQKRGRKRKSRDSLSDHYHQRTVSRCCGKGILDSLNRKPMFSSRKARRKNPEIHNFEDTSDSWYTNSTRPDENSSTLGEGGTSGEEILSGGSRNDQMDLD